MRVVVLLAAGMVLLAGCAAKDGGGDNLDETGDSGSNGPSNGTVSLTATPGPDGGSGGGDSTGNATGNSTGNATGNAPGNVTGNATGNSTGNSTGNQTAGSSTNGNPVTHSCTLSFTGFKWALGTTASTGLGKDECTAEKFVSVSGGNFHSLLLELTWTNGAPGTQNPAFRIKDGAGTALHTVAVSGASGSARVELADDKLPDVAEITITGYTTFQAVGDMDATFKVTLFESATVPEDYTGADGAADGPAKG